MTVALGLTAAVLFLLYSWYFVRIIKGNPQSFELELMKALAQWMVQKGPASKGQIWLMYWSSCWIEILYLGLAFLTLSNPFMQYFTVMVAAMEGYHLFWLALSCKRFFAGQTLISQLFNWRLERMSAISLFSYSLLLLITLIVF